MHTLYMILSLTLVGALAIGALMVFSMVVAGFRGLSDWVGRCDERRAARKATRTR